MKIMLIRRRTPRRARAQALLEMALVLPLLALLLVGVFEFGLVLYAHVQVSNAVREAARAASLYRSTRYFTMTDKINPPSCGTMDGWSLQQTIDQAIVYYKLNSNGCPGTATIDYTSLGWLEPKPSPTLWTVTATPAQSGTSMPNAGDSVTIKLRYPYKLVVLSNFMSYLSDPIWIEKSVKVEYQN